MKRETAGGPTLRQMSVFGWAVSWKEFVVGGGSSALVSLKLKWS